MAVLLARYRINDYTTYKAQFDAFAAVRAEMGSTSHRTFRVPDEPHTVTVVIDFPTVEQARAFAADPRRAEALDRAGVTERVDEVLDEVDAPDH
jgi:uncharacterized protein (DUF1330 family)